MAGMRIFGRRCSLATDDFLFIGAVGFVFYLPWLGWLPVIYAHYLNQRFTCFEDPASTTHRLLDVSFPGVCLLFFFNWLLASFFFIFSSKGTISKPEPRKHVVTLVYIKLFLSCLDVAWAILGTVIMYRDSYCHIEGVGFTIKVVTICQWILAGLRAGMIILFYDCYQPASKKTKNTIEKEFFTAAVRKSRIRRWNLRFQALFLWCTTPSPERRDAIQTAAELMAFLSSDLDLVPSDVIAGLLLYRRKCLDRYKAEKEELENTPPITLQDGSAIDQFPHSNMASWMNLELAKRYFDLGMGIFGWPWVVYRDLTCGCYRVFNRLVCCFPFRSRSKIVRGDNCCGCNLAGLQVTSGLLFEELVHVSFVDRVFEVPFFVNYDHETSSVLISIRGTMSFDDILTDVSAAFSPMDDPGCPAGAVCHGGMLTAAREIKRKLLENGILQAAFEKKPHYHLVLTGHSLGAAVASILTLLLKASYPAVRCFAFAPPPTMNHEGIAQSLENVFTIVYGNDSVVYLNYENVHDMIGEMEKGLKECDLPKYKIFINLEQERSLFQKQPQNGKGAETKNGEQSSKPESGRSEKQREVENGVRSSKAAQKLFVAGTILHIRMTQSGYRLKLTTSDEYKSLAFRPNMIYHHFPQHMQKCLQRLGKSSSVQVASLVSEA